MGSQRVFLCHSSADKPVVRQLYGRLLADGFRPWLDAEDLLPGQDWQYEIRKAIKASDLVVVCLSAESVGRTGFVQKEIQIALDAAEERPEGSIFMIPARLEPCHIPARLSGRHWVELYEEDGYRNLRRAIESVRISSSGRDEGLAVIESVRPRTSGLYVAAEKSADGAAYWNYFRFMRDGRACNYSSTTTAREVAGWLFPGEPGSGIGISEYNVVGTAITIRNVASYGVVEFGGTISVDATELRLHAHSYINGHESFGIWRFESLD